MTEILHLAAVWQHDIAEVYQRLECDYRTVFNYPGHCDALLSRIAWKRSPTREIGLRFFNQLNMAYAERWAVEHRDAHPLKMLIQCSGLILYRHNSSPGFRSQPIAFGRRVGLDALDPRRGFNLFVGVLPQAIPALVQQWCRVAEKRQSSPNFGLMLVLVLIAIHPFRDGNGRIARIAYTWFLLRWGLTIRWLAEGTDGEFLRTGEGYESTEPLMSLVLLRLCGGLNEYRFGQPQQDEELVVRLGGTLQELVDNPSSVLECPQFLKYVAHLEGQGYFLGRSPRFDALRPWIHY